MARRHAGTPGRLAARAFVFVFVFVSVTALAGAGAARAEVQDLRVGGFSVRHVFTVPGTPLQTYDAMTGDISGWWDHTFSERPQRFYIEAKPGGGFYEIFDDSGDGVLHGTVIYAQRGKLLRFRGPLGLSGNAIDMVVSWSYEARGDSTVVTSEAKTAGQFDPSWPTAVDGVWKHFLVDRFKPWVESRRGQAGSGK